MSADSITMGESTHSITLAVLQHVLAGGEGVIKPGKPLTSSGAFEGLSPESAIDLIAFHNDLAGNLFISGGVVSIVITPMDPLSKEVVESITYTEINGKPTLTATYKDGREVTIMYDLVPIEFPTQPPQRRYALVLKVIPGKAEEQKPRKKTRKEEEEREAEEEKEKEKEGEEDEEGEGEGEDKEREEEGH